MSASPVSSLSNTPPPAQPTKTAAAVDFRKQQLAIANKPSGSTFSANQGQSAKPSINTHGQTVGQLVNTKA
jgi:hypothetical protein